MRFDVITTFPEMVAAPLTQSMLGKAITAGLLDIRVHNLRTWTSGPHHQTDDVQYGGGDGMVMLAEPIIQAVEDVLDSTLEASQRLVVVTSPQGDRLTQETAQDFIQYQQLVIVCGHYKGIDERVIEYLRPREISIGDFVLTGGEIPALAVIDATARMAPGVLKSFGSAEEDTFYSGLLDCPRYTRPRELRGLAVPEVLLSGHHEQIAQWRQEQSRQRTRQRRPDLYRQLTQQDRPSDEQD
jgi:tRNA (guanine37-N1)-methyltransferase